MSVIEQESMFGDPITVGRAGEYPLDRQRADLLCERCGAPLAIVEVAGAMLQLDLSTAAERGGKHFALPHHCTKESAP